MNAKSLDAAQQYFVTKGTQQKALDMTTVVDTSFADAAVKEIGIYKP